MNRRRDAAQAGALAASVLSLNTMNSSEEPSQSRRGVGTAGLDTRVVPRTGLRTSVPAWLDVRLAVPAPQWAT